MRRRQALPTMLLMTDERMGDRLWSAIARLPRGAGVVVRHYSLPRPERRALFERIRCEARRRGLVMLLAGQPREAVGWRADGVHGATRHVRASRPLLWSAPCHGRPALVAGRRAGRDLRLISPLFATRSHPGASALGRARFGLLVGKDREGVVALGGMTAQRARSLAGLGVTRWAAIDAWIDES